MIKITSERVLFVAKQLYPEGKWVINDNGDVVYNDEHEVKILLFELEQDNRMKWAAAEWLFDNGGHILKVNGKHVVMSDMIPPDHHSMVSEDTVGATFIVAISMIGGYQE